MRLKIYLYSFQAIDRLEGSNISLTVIFKQIYDENCPCREQDHYIRDLQVEMKAYRQTSLVSEHK